MIEMSFLRRSKVTAMVNPEIIFFKLCVEHFCSDIEWYVNAFHV